MRSIIPTYLLYRIVGFPERTVEVIVQPMRMELQRFGVSNDVAIALNGTVDARLPRAIQPIHCTLAQIIHGLLVPADLPQRFSHRVGILLD